MKVRLIHAPGEEVELVNEVSVYAPRGTVYILQEGVSFVAFARSMYTIEKDRSEWIRKYENVLNGLKYWKNKALTGE